MNYELYHGDCLDVMATFPDNTFTAIVTDPPYGLGETPDIAELMQQWITEGRADMGKGFMGREWDVVPGPVYWREMFRVAKPGAYLLACCGTRTVDLMSIAIRFGGWVKFDEISYHMGQGLPSVIDWCYGSGFPKSAAIDKLIDARLGKTDEREVVGKPSHLHSGKLYKTDKGWNSNSLANCEDVIITAPATPEAAQFAGYGTALKPAHEIILCFRKPVDKGYANNALTHGCGGLNIDGCRIPITDGATMARNNKPGDNGWKNSSGGANNAALHGEPLGRWPANLIWDGSPEVKAEFDKAGESGGKTFVKGGPPRSKSAHIGQISGQPRTDAIMNYGDTGGASRFFTVCPPDAPRFVYMAKASSSERNEGLDGMEVRPVASMQGNLVDGQRLSDKGTPIKTPQHENFHPTVKPVSLMSWLCRLVRQPANNLILDPFGGSGTTGVAALLEDCDVVVIEREAEYIPIIRQRLDHYEAAVNMEPVKIKGKPTDTADLPLFA